MAMASFTGAANGTTVEVATKKPFAVLLEENPTTGYRWHLETDPGIRVISSDYEAAAGIGVGGGGTRRFVLTAEKPGEWQVRAKLWRQWLGDASITRRFELAVRAR